MRTHEQDETHREQGHPHCTQHEWVTNGGTHESQEPATNWDTHESNWDPQRILRANWDTHKLGSA